ncbi:helix-turn-helix domain-containing protein [Anaerocolumna sedimenticola]|uniref:Helix-turn-helix domain-containing protein n=1 Tax=Anaerocolumna sedimenticola TaxID=2696063 RepID=A0A6P1TKI5_9FIRM|nr:helix-turn-helix transcriptional regulator [Anaerocolumna sedimenticola]QHQ60561.1 helix-turn-helix domain-containing protein [Anaerocolumna sedimenticola]
MTNLGGRLKDLRLKKGLTQAELGNLSGIHHTNIGRIENKNAIPQADVLYFIAKNLDTSVEWLLTGEFPESPFHNKPNENTAADSIPCDDLLAEFLSLYQQLNDNERNEVIRFAKFIIYQKNKESS